MKDKKTDSILYSQALALASIKHCGQTRKNGDPYILHPIRVSNMIKEAGYGLEYQITGLLHDLLEDTSASEKEIEEFGHDVLEAVKLLSKNYCKNKNKYIENILNNHIAAVVKNADRIDNLLESRIADINFQKRYLKNSKENYLGKFSKALDNTIELLETTTNFNEINLNNFNKEQLNLMELYSDKEKNENKLKEEKIQELLKIKNNSKRPDKHNSKLVYFEAWGIIYCAYEIDEEPYVSDVWKLTEIGWVPSNINIYDTYGYDLENVSRDYVIDIFKTKKEKGYFISEYITEEDI